MSFAHEEHYFLLVLTVEENPPVFGSELNRGKGRPEASRQSIRISNIKCLCPPARTTA